MKINSSSKKERKNMQYKIVAIMGKAGAGKDTLLQEMIGQDNERFNEIVSYTTRPPREGEIDGINYHFVGKNSFLAQIHRKEMLEFSEFRGWYYGTSINGLDPDKINVGVFNPTGVTSLLECPNVKLYLIYIIAADKIRLIRQLEREESPDVNEIVRRYLTDQEDFKIANQLVDKTNGAYSVIINDGEVPMVIQADIVNRSAIRYMDNLN